MFRRVMLAVDQTLPSFGHELNHVIIEELLDKAKVPGWTKAGVFSWKGRGRNAGKELEEAASEANADLIHITSQEHGHLVPRKTSTPVVISIHDLFDHRPRSMEAGDTVVTLGARKPSQSRAKQIDSSSSGMSRANLILCSSNKTLEDSRTMFPSSRSILVRDSIDADFWDPARNPRSREKIGRFDEPDKLLLVSVGGEDKRWRNQFLDRVMQLLPAGLSDEINLVRIGTERLDDEEIAAAYQHAEAMLYPGVSVGFRCPPLEAMAAGCPVLASNLPNHAEILRDENILHPSDVDAWVSALVSIHNDWRRAGRVSRLNDEKLALFARSTMGRDSHGNSLSEAYGLALQ